MGFAIQRGATCAVVAVEEVIAQRSARRLAAMAEASLWVAGGLVVAQAAGLHVSRADGSPLVYNRENTYLPDLLICRPELAEQVLALYRALPVTAE